MLPTVSIAPASSSSSSLPLPPAQPQPQPASAASSSDKDVFRSMAVPKNSKTPYSDATQVGEKESKEVAKTSSRVNETSSAAEQRGNIFVHSFQCAGNGNLTFPSIPILWWFSLSPLRPPLTGHARSSESFIHPPKHRVQSPLLFSSLPLRKR